jgi:hypothetical protein
MRAKQAKLLTVPANGQISIGKSWAGRQIKVEEIGDNEIRISSGVFVPDSQRAFHTEEAKQSLDAFNKWEVKSVPKATDVESLFASLKKNKQKRAK